MRTTNREATIIIIASLMLIGAYYFPIWQIDLNAPQYPEGIGLRIWVDKITGTNEFDLSNINKLNHYIGMKEIEPNSIPELLFMKYILAFFILTGLLIGTFRFRKAVPVWMFLLIFALAAGIYDYYLWGYDYGHDLNPDAPIKVPGMAYQPPLIGGKQLLNMNSVSLPGIGSYFIGLSILLMLYTIYTGRKSKMKVKKTVLQSMLLIGLLLSGCTSEPEPIRYGSDTCDHCNMQISDPRFGSELVTAKGKILKFDSIECLAAYSVRHTDSEGDLFVTDIETKELINKESAYFMKSEQLKSPMGLNLSAIGDSAAFSRNLEHFSGQKLQWDEICAYVNERWYE